MPRKVLRTIQVLVLLLRTNRNRKNGKYKKDRNRKSLIQGDQELRT